LGKKGVLIRGDFRNQAVLEACHPYAPFNVTVVDCNILSSLEASIRYSLTHLIDGGVLFVDDYLSNFGQGVPRVPNMLRQLATECNRRLYRHGFYAPFAQSFIVCSSRDMQESKPGLANKAIDGDEE
jgi:hypothetical protein